MRVFTFILSIILSFLLFLSCGTEFIPTYPLITSVVGEGTISPAGGRFEVGETVTLTSSPSQLWRFVEWSGDVSSTKEVIEVIIEGTTKIIATFEPDWPRDTETIVVDVFNPVTERIWMDRNLGASRVATSPTDAQSYGDLYQWGRGADGHQKKNSPTTTMLSNSDQPGHGSFIRPTGGNYDWRSPQKNWLWNPTNNPCPIGYRVPSATEWDAELRSWSSRDSAGAFASPLRLPLAGDRLRDGSLRWAGSKGFYWSVSIPSGDALQAIYAERLYLFIHDASMGNQHRAAGYSVRCIKG